MAEFVTIKTQPRSLFGGANTRRLRKQGLMPAVLYGHKEETVPVVLQRDEFDEGRPPRRPRRGPRDDGKTEKALIRELQWDHLGKEVLHVDFKRVCEDERIIIGVPIELRGIAPGVTGGGVLDQPLHTCSTSSAWPWPCRSRSASTSASCSWARRSTSRT